MKVTGVPTVVLAVGPGVKSKLVAVIATIGSLVKPGAVAETPSQLVLKPDGTVTVNVQEVVLVALFQSSRTKVQVVAGLTVTPARLPIPPGRYVAIVAVPL